jgi:hypothetical protein
MQTASTVLTQNFFRPLVFILISSQSLLISSCGSGVGDQWSSVNEQQTLEFVEPVYMGRPFAYDFFGSDVLPWINGSRTGRVPTGISKQAAKTMKTPSLSAMETWQERCASISKFSGRR